MQLITFQGSKYLTVFEHIYWLRCLIVLSLTTVIRSGYPLLNKIKTFQNQHWCNQVSGHYDLSSDTDLALYPLPQLEWVFSAAKGTTRKIFDWMICLHLFSSGDHAVHLTLSKKQVTPASAKKLMSFPNWSQSSLPEQGSHTQRTPCCMKWAWWQHWWQTLLLSAEESEQTNTAACPHPKKPLPTWNPKLMEQKPFTQTPLNISTASTGAGMRQQVDLHVASVEGCVLLGGNRCSWD